MTKRRIHAIDKSHRANQSNPPMPGCEVTNPHGFAYRRHPCGQVSYCKRGPDGAWVWQNGQPLAYDFGHAKVTCNNCKRYGGAGWPKNY